MVQFLLRIEEAEAEQIKQQATEFGLSASAFIRQIVKASLRKDNQKEQAPENFKKNIRALVPVLAEALGRMTKDYNKEKVDKLSQILLKAYDQETQK
jgi:CRISPR/Cas system CSM-associated protein Csm2 small subunit